MKITVEKSRVIGRVSVPSSKSMTLRGLMCAALAKGESEIVHPLVSDDTAAAADVLGKVGITIRKEPGVWRVSGGTLRASDQELHCGESATTLRFMTAICSLIPGRHRLVGGPSLSKRPVKSLVEALKKVGVDASIEGKTTPPVTVVGSTLKGGIAELPGNISSQFISALLFIAPFAGKEMSVRLTTPLTSRPYVLMTLWCLRKFGINVHSEMDKFVVRRQSYTPARLEVEGDWSSASYFLALGAVSQGIEVDNLSTASLQGDRIILDFLRGMGAGVTVVGNSITVRQERLRGIVVDLSDCIDLLPTMAVLAALADGKSEFTGIERARIKESNRVAAVKEGLLKLGVAVTEDRDRLTIVGLKTPKKAADGDEPKKDDNKKDDQEKVEDEARAPVTVDSHGDHRIAMAFAVLGAAVGGVTIDSAECVAKTFPGFWDAMKGLGGDIKTGG
ncbi:MAG: 3-phosphoshikimate 1-carboxyvinyltransferase [Chloroflexi bacterium RBG_16_56_11]|nr:MAG: 3-phosphoshikimate 1-carboxyvinyltransferase [Chloroflexi bacterium RBG_16_56_11]